jgi:hypothetical protein
MNVGPQMTILGFYELTVELYEREYSSQRFVVYQ